MAKTDMEQAIRWCAKTLGSAEIVSDHSKVHGGHESSACRLRTSSGFCYLKVHHTSSHWHNEVHAYERWARAFGDHAPVLLAVHDEPPLALVVTEIPGQIAGQAALSTPQQLALWRSAGTAIRSLHDLEPGRHFGPCRRDGSPIASVPTDARSYVRSRLEAAIQRAVEGQYISPAELATLRSACELASAFEGERPTPCHRDYSEANWLVNADGGFAGVIDFDFAHWDVRVADFARDADWKWLRQPELVEAFFEGYGWAPTPAQEQQLFVARAEYSLSAILWGRDHAFHGFEQEGREALLLIRDTIPFL